MPVLSPSSIRHSTITFIENSNLADATVVYAGVQSTDSYVSYTHTQTMQIVYMGFSPQLFDVVGSCIGQPSCTEEVTNLVYSISSVVPVMMM